MRHESGAYRAYKPGDLLFYMAKSGLASRDVLLQVLQGRPYMSS